MPPSVSLLRTLRLVHLYFGVFIAPALLFFAFTGALQTFGLHETSRGSTYVPPRWAVVLGQIHKKQSALVTAHRSLPPERQVTAGTAAQAATPPVGGAVQVSPERHAQPAPRADDQPKRHPLPLKIFFLLVSLGLISSTITGIYLSYKYNPSSLVVTGLLLAGALIPVLLVFV